MKRKNNFLPVLLAAIGLSVAAFRSQVGPPALTTSSFMKHGISFEQCRQKSKEIMAKMNLDIEDHGNGTIGGFGEQSVAVVNCHRLGDATYVQVAVAGQKQDAAEMIMRYLVEYLRAASADRTPKPLAPLPKPAYPQQ